MKSKKKNNFKFYKKIKCCFITVVIGWTDRFFLYYYFNWFCYILLLFSFMNFYFLLQVSKLVLFCFIIFTAPEILRGEPYSHSVDWWSLGIIICQMFIKKVRVFLIFFFCVNLWYLQIIISSESTAFWGVSEKQISNLFLNVL